MSASRPIVPLTEPPDVTVRVPGSKSITNRALVAAALAQGESRLEGVLFADDTEAMLAALERLGFALDIDRERETVVVQGGGGAIPVAEATLDARQSGTTARFLLPMLALGRGRYRVDADEQMRARPMGPSIDALRTLGVRITEDDHPGHLPVTIDADGLQGGSVRLPGDVSSQFLSGLMLSAPCCGWRGQCRDRGSAGVAAVRRDDRGDDEGVRRVSGDQRGSGACRSERVPRPRSTRSSPTPAPRRTSSRLPPSRVVG